MPVYKVKLFIFFLLGLQWADVVPYGTILEGSNILGFTGKEGPSGAQDSIAIQLSLVFSRCFGYQSGIF